MIAFLVTIAGAVRVGTDTPFTCVKARLAHNYPYSLSRPTPPPTGTNASIHLLLLLVVHCQVNASELSTFCAKSVPEKVCEIGDFEYVCGFLID